MAYSVNLTELNAALGAYCRENKADLFSELVLNSRFEERFTVLDGVTDETPLVTLQMTDIVKPAKADTFAPTADAVKFPPRMLKVRGMKVDLKIVPQELYNSWLGMNKRKGRADTGYLPFEEFIIAHIIKKARENVHLKGLYKGVYNASGTGPIDTMDGILKIVADDITANNISSGNGNLVTTSAITSANVIDKLQLVYDGLGEAAKDTDTIMKVNSQIFTWFQRAVRTEFGQNMDYTGMTSGRSLMLDGTMCKLISEPGLGTSQRILCGIPDVFVLGTDSADDANQVEIEKEKRWLNIMMDFGFGVQLRQINGGVFVTNEQV
jgi:hypothetical protein